MIKIDSNFIFLDSEDDEFSFSAILKNMEALEAEISQELEKA